MSKRDGPSEGYPLDRYIDTVSICPYLLDRSGGHRVVIATFWRTLHYDGKIQPDGGGGACTPIPFIYHHVQSCCVPVCSS
jgi:hypothetical protein